MKEKRFSNSAEIGEFTKHEEKERIVRLSEGKKETRKKGKKERYK